MLKLILYGSVVLLWFTFPFFKLQVTKLIDIYLHVCLLQTRIMSSVEVLTALCFAVEFLCCLNLMYVLTFGN